LQSFASVRFRAVRNEIQMTEPLQAISEGTWLWALGRDQRTLFLGLLANNLTVVGRNSYRAQTEELDQPRQLRMTNEILNRVTSCLRDALTGSESSGFVESMGPRVLEPQDHELSQLTHWAWQNAKDRVVGASPCETPVR